jgi:citrate synthase
MFPQKESRHEALLAHVQPPEGFLESQTAGDAVIGERVNIDLAPWSSRGRPPD